MRPKLKLRDRRHQRPSPIIVVLVLVLWSLLLGWGLSLAIGTSTPLMVRAQTPAIERQVPIDAVPADLGLAVNTYQNSCGACHVAIPPQLLPTQRWVEIMENPAQHFGINLRTPRQSGVNVPPVSNVDIRLMWDYIRFASRADREDAPLPARVGDSRFFWALHPRVAETCRVTAASPTPTPGISCPDRATIATCVGCHPAARAYDYAKLTPAWENSL